MSTPRQSAAVRVALALTLISISLLTSAGSQAVGARPAAATKLIYIGEVVPLTGGGSVLPAGGPYEQAGAQLAVSQINAHGGINGRYLKLFLADDQSTIPAGAVAAFQRLARLGVAAVLVPNFSREVQALTPAIKQAGIPTMIGGTTSVLTHEGDPWVFRTRSMGTYATRVLSAYAVTTLHLSKIAVLHTTDVAGTRAEVELLAELKDLGVTPVADQPFPANATDLTAQLQAIKASGATALISYGAFQPADVALIGRQMRQLGMHLTWLGNSDVITAAALKQGGALLEGIYATTDYMSGQNPEAVAFESALAASYHLPGNQADAYAYDAINLLALAMRDAGTNPQTLRTALLAIKGYRGAMGIYTFDANGDGLHQQTVVQSIHGQLRIVKILTF